jgi:hypothetical protein
MSVAGYNLLFYSVVTSLKSKHNTQIKEGKVEVVKLEEKPIDDL